MKQPRGALYQTAMKACRLGEHGESLLLASGPIKPSEKTEGEGLG